MGWTMTAPGRLDYIRGDLIMEPSASEVGYASAGRTGFPPLLCTQCGSLIAKSEDAMRLHSSWHDMIASVIDLVLGALGDDDDQE